MGLVLAAVGRGRFRELRHRLCPRSPLVIQTWPLTKPLAQRPLRGVIASITARIITNICLQVDGNARRGGGAASTRGATRIGAGGTCAKFHGLVERASMSKYVHLVIERVTVTVGKARWLLHGVGIHGGAVLSMSGGLHGQSLGGGTQVVGLRVCCL